MQIIPIASGKGGVGKSLLSANLAISLAQSGKSVVAVDLDLGGSNLHTILGMRGLSFGIGTFLNNPNLDFADAIMDTDIPGLRFIPGDNEIPGMANLKVAQKNKLIRHLKKIEADYLIIDLGAGTTFNTVDFFLLSNHGVVVTTPTLTATLNAYFFLKNVVYRIMVNCFKKGSFAQELLYKVAKTGTGLQKLYIPKLLDQVQEKDKESYDRFQQVIGRFQPRLVFNLLEDPSDAEKAEKVRRSTREYLGIDLEHMGVVYRDEVQTIALSSRLPVVLYKPQSVLSQAIHRIADKFLSYQEEDEEIIDLQSIEESHVEAQMEAEVDFGVKLDHLSDLLQSGALSMGDLIETVKSQQFEINQLKKENNLLKSKLVKAINQGYKI
jgi:flagellar biosynthesis protein FlhG